MPSAQSQAFTIHGAEDVRRRLNALPGRLLKSVVRRAAKNSMSHVTKEAKRRVPVRIPIPGTLTVAKGGTLKKSIRVKVKTYALTGTVTVNVGPQIGMSVYDPSKKTKRHVPSRMAHLIEFGHRNRNGSFTPAQPFMRAALESKQGAVVAKYRRELRVGLERAVKQLAIRGK